MSRTNVYKLLKETIGVTVYQDFVPETATLPAASYFRINSTTQKPLTASPDLRQSQYQIDIVSGVSRLEADAMADKIRAIDGKTDHENFQLISIVADTDMPRPDPSVNVFGVTIDVEFTQR